MIYWVFLAMPYFTLLALWFTWSNFLTHTSFGEPSEKKENVAVIFCFIIFTNTTFIGLQELF